MTPPGQASEILTVVEHKAFASLYQQELSQQGVEIEVVEIDKVPRTTVAIFPDEKKPSFGEMEIALPTVSEEYRIVPELGDLDVGEWQGVMLTDLLESEPELLAAWTSDPTQVPPAGESVAALCARVGAWLEGFREEGHFIVVTHPFVIRAALLHALAAGPASFNAIDIEPLSVVDLRRNGHWRLRF